MAPTIRSVSTVVFDGPSSTIGRPEAAATGDLLLLIHSADNGTLADMQVSGSWQVAGTAGGSVGNWAGTKVWQKIVTAGDPDTYTISQGATADGVAVMVAISGATTGLVIENISRQSQTISIMTPAATPPAIGCLELRWAAGVRFASTAITWFTPGEYDEITTLQSRTHATGALVARGLTNNAPVGAAEFLTSLGLNVWNGVTILVPPPSGGGPGGEPPPPTSPPPTIPAIPSSERVVHYVYEFCDLLTDALICKDLDLYEVSYDRRIIEAGTFSATLKIVDEATAVKVARIVPRHPDDLSTGPGRTIAHVYRNGVIWGSYVIWRASVSRSGRSEPIQVRIEGASLESYLKQVKIRTDLSYDGVDQLDIARGLLTTMQATPRYDIGLILQGGASSATASVEYLASEASTYGDRLAELASADDGFEWAVQTIDNDDGTRSRYWVWGYPTLGTTSAHVFTEPGNVLSWSEDIDALRGGTTFQVRGQANNADASTSSEPLVSEVVLAQAHLTAGWPGIDVTADQSGLSDGDALTRYATWWASRRSGAVRVHEVTVRLPAATTFGPGNLGDWVTVMLVNPWWPITNGVASFSKSWRVVGMAFKPPAKGSGQEECTLTLEEEADA
ncbi:hypothetical protein [Streptosporangium sp. NPDC051022]|uniref:hypothetical protein n=1 Tax=Streptosporangium sp. NPDC051022 TaxID=3155752 RepID=UPI003425CE6C